MSQTLKGYPAKCQVLICSVGVTEYLSGARPHMSASGSQRSNSLCPSAKRLFQVSGDSRCKEVENDHLFSRIFGQIRNVGPF